MAKTWAKRVMQAHGKTFTPNNLQGPFPPSHIQLREGPGMPFFVQIIKCFAFKAHVICDLLLRDLHCEHQASSFSLFPSPQRQTQLFIVMPIHCAPQTQSRSLLKNEFEGLNSESALSYRGSVEFLWLENDLSGSEQANKSKTLPLTLGHEVTTAYREAHLYVKEKHT